MCGNSKTHFSSSLLYILRKCYLCVFWVCILVHRQCLLPHVIFKKIVRNLKHIIWMVYCDIKMNKHDKELLFKKRYINQYIARIWWYFQKPFYIIIFFFRCYHYVISHDICIISWWDAASIWWFTIDRLAKDLYPTTQNVITKTKFKVFRYPKVFSL